MDTQNKIHINPLDTAPLRSLIISDCRNIKSVDSIFWPHHKFATMIDARKVEWCISQLANDTQITSERNRGTNRIATAHIILACMFCVVKTTLKCHHLISHSKDWQILSLLAKGFLLSKFWHSIGFLCYYFSKLLVWVMTFLAFIGINLFRWLIQSNHIVLKCKTNKFSKTTNLSTKRSVNWKLCEAYSNIYCISKKGAGHYRL